MLISSVIFVAISSFYQIKAAAGNSIQSALFVNVPILTRQQEWGFHLPWFSAHFGLLHQCWWWQNLQQLSGLIANFFFLRLLELTANLFEKELTCKLRAGNTWRIWHFWVFAIASTERTRRLFTLMASFQFLRNALQTRRVAITTVHVDQWGE